MNLSFVLGFLALCVAASSSPAHAAVLEHLQCNRNADCILVKNSCGGPKAINKTFEKDHPDGPAIGDCDRTSYMYWPKRAKAICKKNRCEVGLRKPKG